jgi:long-chain acyl-CoA synthetase
MKLTAQAPPETSSGTFKTLEGLISNFSRYSNSDAITMFGADGKRRTPYKELSNLVAQLSNALLNKGIERGEPILLISPNSPEMIVAALAVINSGGVAVPVDLQSSDEILQHIVKDSSAKRIFTDTRGLEKLRRLKIDNKLELYLLDDEESPDYFKKIFSEKEAPRSELKAEEQAVIFYTSGTTGMPKGVPLTHQNLVTQIEAVKGVELLQPGDKGLLPLPLFHVYPFVVGMLSQLALGLNIVIPKSVTGPEITKAMKEGQVTVLFAVPRLMRALHSAIESKYRAHQFSSAVFDISRGLSNFVYLTTRLNAGKQLFAPVHKQFPGLRLIACGGALLDPELARSYRSLGWRIAIGYGLTETSPLLTIRMPDNLDLESVGKAVPGVEIRLEPITEEDEEGEDDEQETKEKSKSNSMTVDKTVSKTEPESKTDSQEDSKSSQKAKPDAESKPEPQSKQTEIQARGANIFSGYRNLPEKTKETFTEDGWFKTGDIGEMKHGNLHITGRISIMIKSEGGKKIQPDEVEEAYAKDPVIREIGVLQLDNKLVALVVPDLKIAGTSDTAKKVSEAINKRSGELESYLRVNDFAISREPLPRTNLGKVKRKDLIDRYKKAKSEGARSGEVKKGKQAVNEMSAEDQMLLQEPVAEDCWTWLGERFPEASLSMDSSPQVDLNIDSLEWLNLTLEIRERMGVDLNEEAISRIDTVRDLIKEIIDAARLGIDKTSPLLDPEKVLDDDQKKWLKPLNPSMKFMSGILYWTTRAIMRTLFRTEAVGMENLKDKQVVFTPNHASYLDAFALASVLPYKRLKKSQWAGWAGIALANPFNAFIYRLAQAIPIEATKSLVSSLALGAAVLKKHRNLIWFPEGTRTEDGNLLKFKSGIGLLLQSANVPTIPVYLYGTREALPPGAFFPKLVKIKVIFGESVLPKELLKEGEGNNDQEKIANALQKRVASLRPNKSSNKASDKASENPPAKTSLKDSK